MEIHIRKQENQISTKRPPALDDLCEGEIARIINKDAGYNRLDDIVIGVKHPEAGWFYLKGYTFWPKRVHKIGDWPIEFLKEDEVLELRNT